MENSSSRAARAERRRRPRISSRKKSTCGYCFLNRRHKVYRGKSYLQWLVRWKGYGETHDTWEFDDDVKEDMDVEAYASIRSAFEQVQSGRSAQEEVLVPPAVVVAPPRTARQTRASRRG